MRENVGVYSLCVECSILLNIYTLANIKDSLDGITIIRLSESLFSSIPVLSRDIVVAVEI